MQVRLLGVFRNLVGLVLPKSHQIESIFFPSSVQLLVCLVSKKFYQSF